MVGADVSRRPPAVADVPVAAPQAATHVAAAVQATVGRAATVAREVTAREVVEAAAGARSPTRGPAVEPAEVLGPVPVATSWSVLHPGGAWPGVARAASAATRARRIAGAARMDDLDLGPGQPPPPVPATPRTKCLAGFVKCQVPRRSASRRWGRLDGVEIIRPANAIHSRDDPGRHRIPGRHS